MVDFSLEYLKNLTGQLLSMSILPISVICINYIFSNARDQLIEHRLFNVDFFSINFNTKNKEHTETDSIDELIIEKSFILNYFYLDVSDSASIINYINYHFIKELIIFSQNNANLNTNALITNRAFFYLLKQMLLDEKIQISFTNYLQDSFDRFNFSIFLEILNESDGDFNYTRLLKYKRIIKLFLDYLINHYKI